MIKNLISTLLESAFLLNQDDFNKKLASHPFSPCSGSEKLKIGYAIHDDTDLFVRSIGNHLVFKFITEKKSVPGPVVKAELADQVKKYTEQFGEKPNKGIIRDMKENIIATMLPRAFPKRSELLIWIDTEAQRVNFATSSAKAAEEAISFLHRALGDMPKTYLIDTKDTPQRAMTNWLLSDEPPSGFTVDDKCENVTPIEGKPTIKYVRHDLNGEEIRSYIGEGMVVTSLALTHNNEFSFMLNDKFVIKGIKSTDMINDRVIEDDLEWAGEFLLYADGLSSMTTDLIEALGGLHDRNDSESNEDEQEEKLAA